GTGEAGAVRRWAVAGFASMRRQPTTNRRRGANIDCGSPIRVSRYYIRPPPDGKPYGVCGVGVLGGTMAWPIVLLSVPNQIAFVAGSKNMCRTTPPPLCTSVSAEHCSVRESNENKRLACDISTTHCRA